MSEKVKLGDICNILKCLMTKRLLPAGLNQRVGCLRIKDDRFQLVEKATFKILEVA